MAPVNRSVGGMASGAAVSGATVSLWAWPTADNLADGDDGTQGEDLLETDEQITQPDGGYTLTPDLTAVPADYVNASGAISFEMHVQTDSQSFSYGFIGSATTPQTEPIDPGFRLRVFDIAGLTDILSIDVFVQAVGSALAGIVMLRERPISVSGSMPGRRRGTPSPGSWSRVRRPGRSVG